MDSWNAAEKLIDEHALSKAEAVVLLEGSGDPDLRERLRREAVRLRERYYGKKVFARGLIEFTNYCRNNCYYCGIRAGNANIRRYRLSEEEILGCCRQGHALGYRTFVLQGGEDPYFTPERTAEIVREIKSEFPDSAVTLSVGERPFEVYQRWKEAGADRYLLREESAAREHYAELHPAGASLAKRKQCLFDLKRLGYQVGAGFMVGSPGQTAECIAEDLLFLQELKPQMVGIGPFIPHHDTRYAGEPAGSAELTLYLLSVIRILLPKCLLPATTALGTIDPRGREKGMLAGANVVMPNLSPAANRKQYELYDNKICTGEESAQCTDCLERRMASVGYEVTGERGDAVS